MASKSNFISSNGDNSLFSLTNHIQFGRKVTSKISSERDRSSQHHSHGTTNTALPPSNHQSARKSVENPRRCKSAANALKPPSSHQSDKKTIEPPSSKRLTSPLKNIPNGGTNHKKPRYYTELNTESMRATMTINNNNVDNSDFDFKQKTKSQIPMDFLKKFKKNFDHMTRQDLENLVLQKIVEGITRESVCGEMKIKLDEYAKIMDDLRKKFQELQTEYIDLHKIHTRLCVELEKHTDCNIKVIKYSRSVGIQVGNSCIKPIKKEQIQIKRTEVPAFIDLTDSLDHSLIDDKDVATNLNENVARTSKSAGETQTENEKSESYPPNKRSNLPIAAVKPGKTSRSSSGSSSSQNKPRSPVAQNFSIALKSIVHDLKAESKKQCGQTETENNVRLQRTPPLPPAHYVSGNPSWKRIPPRPIVEIDFTDKTEPITIKWTFDESANDYAKIAYYQMYRYKQSHTDWVLMDRVDAMPLPIAVTLEQFETMDRYFFVVRAVDEHNRTGLFSTPQTWK